MKFAQTICEQCDRIELIGIDELKSNSYITADIVKMEEYILYNARNKHEKKRFNAFSADPLFEQKRAITVATFEYLGAIVVLFVLVIILMRTTFYDKQLQPVFGYLMSFGFLTAFLFYCIFFVRRFNIFWKIRKIEFSNEKTVVVHCRKISFLVHPVSKYSSAILGIILKDEMGNKFYYVYPERSAPSDLAKKDIKEQYLGSIEIVCYRNTNIVKRLPH